MRDSIKQEGVNAIAVLEVGLKLKKAQRAMKRLYGDEFEEKIKPWKDGLKVFCEAAKLDPLEGVLKLIGDEEDPQIQLMFLTAAVELVETS